MINARCMGSERVTGGMDGARKGSKGGGVVDVVYLFELYHQRERVWLMQRVGDPDDADDVLASAYLKAIEFLNSESRHVQFPGTWFRAIVRNSYIDFVRYRNRQKRPDAHCQELDETIDVAGPEDHDLILERLAAKDDAARLLAHTELSEREKAIVMRKLNGGTDAGIAAEMRLSSPTVRKGYLQAMEKLTATALLLGVGNGQ